MSLPGALLALLILAASGSAAAEPRDPDAAALERYRLGHLALAGGDFAAARVEFESIPADSVLGDYAAFFTAETLLRAGAEGTALDRFRSFLERFPDSTLASQAVLALADTAFRLGRWPEAEREARRFLKVAPHHPEAGRLLVRLAAARGAQGLVTDAIADLRRRWIEAPASLWGQVAREIAEDLAAAHGVPIAPLGVEERLLQAQRLSDASDFAGAARVLGELLAQGPEAATRHRALLALAPALGRLQRATEAIGVLQGAVAEPAGPWHAALLAELARLHRRAGQLADSVAVLERLASEYPDSPLAPDAWLALGRSRLDLGQTEAARGAFRALVKAFPDTPAAAAAQWELGWQHYRGAQWREAAGSFRLLGAGTSSFRHAGLYWAGRALEAAAEKGLATALYRELVGRAPHSYYGILAARRIRGAPPAPIADPVRLAADPIALLEPERRFQKGRALWRLGFEAHALAELEAVGREALVDADRAWSLAVAFAQIGESGRSLRYLRRAFGPAAEAGSPGLTEQFWRLLYPFGHAELVKEAARRVGLDPYFVAAVIREESSYDARARSWVGAVGLMQLMPETARVVAATAGMPLREPAGLWEPPVNIALGAHYLAELRARFQEPLLAVASYNAGPHRVQQWLGARRTADLEEFVDQIPFDETRGFVKRVFTSWHHYRRLYAALERQPRRGEAEATPRASR